MLPSSGDPSLSGCAPALIQTFERQWASPLESNSARKFRVAFRALTACAAWLLNSWKVVKEGHGSKTAELVCAGRALAHGRVLPGRFSDPTAEVLLDESSRSDVRRARAGERPVGLKARLWQGYLHTQAAMMVARTVWLDERISAAHQPQLVILGAGLDGRAWRMEALRDVSVFEVDHPSSQQVKRERAESLRPVSCDIRFVPVDLARDALDDALAAAGHDDTRASTWLWEGVVMYLSRLDIEATLTTIRRRSAPGSRLLVLYHRPSWILGPLGFLLGRIGEPLRSAFTPEELRALLAAHGFTVEEDEDLATAGRKLAPELGDVAERVKHLRLAAAVRA
jgi:methyltransferase (TIGR00027 family)